MTNYLVKTIESTRAYKKNVGGVDLNSLASSLPSSILLRHIDNCTLHHLQHSLLNTLPTNISQLVNAGNCSNLVNLVKEDDARLSLVDIKVGILQELAHNRLYILSNIAGHGEGGTITDGKGDIQAPSRN